MPNAIGEPSTPTTEAGTDRLGASGLTVTVSVADPFAPTAVSVKFASETGTMLSEDRFHEKTLTEVCPAVAVNE
jgi:hypothetical protein